MGKSFIIKHCRLLSFIIFSILPFPLTAQTDKYEQAYLHYWDMEYDKSYIEFREFASEEDPYRDLVFIYAEHLYYGLGVDPNRSEALKYYMKSADLGYKYAQSKVCEILYKDNDIIFGKTPNEKNQKLIYKYSKLFCTNPEDESPVLAENECALLLSLSYMNGWGCEKNPKLATMWLAYAEWYDSSGISEEYLSKQYPEYNKLGSDWDKEVFAFNIMDSIVSPYLEDTYICDTYWKSYYYLLNGKFGVAKKYMLMTLNNPNISRTGKKESIEGALSLGMFVDSETRDKLEVELQDLIDIDDDEVRDWGYAQRIKVLTYTDRVLNE